MVSTIFRVGAAVIGLGTLLAGCTVGPNFTSPAKPTQTGYRAGGEAATAGDQKLDLGKQITGDWWRLYHSEPLTDVVRQAIAGNKTIMAAAASLAQARQVVAEATGGLFPQVDLSASGERQKLSPAGFGLQKLPPGFQPVFNTFEIGPRVSYSLDIFGGTRRTIEEAGALADAADYDVDGAYLSLTGNAVTLVFNIASINAQIHTVNGIIADDDANLRLVNLEVKAGSGTQLDVETATSQMAADRTLMPPLRQQLSQARHALAVLIGRAPADWTPPDFDLGAFVLPGDLPVSLPSALVRQRPDILLAEARLHAASAAVGVATAALYPNITLSASLTQEALSPDQLFWGANNFFTFGAGLTAPIFHGGELQAQRAAAEAAYDAALANYEQTVLQAFAQVADTLDALQNDADLVAEQQRAVRSAESSLRLTRMAYRGGSIGILQVVDAQRVLEQARIGNVRAVAQRLIDTQQLFLSMGGAWWDWSRAGAGDGKAVAKPMTVSAPAK